MSDHAEAFVKKSLISSIYMTFGIEFILFMLVSRMESGFLIMLISFPIIFFVLLFYFLQFPIVKISKIDKEINKEIIFAARFLVVELESGVTLYDAMKNMAKNYKYVGAYFNEILNKVNIGTSIELAITETIETCASDSLIKILWQISNSLKTGSDIGKPLKTVTENLIKEQRILVDEYAKKLNPLAMFYMLIAIIMPSLGVTMLTIISIFAGIQLNLMVLLLIVAANGFMQFMFVAIINGIRPPVEL
jgi:flagellar protein FlaJ